MPRKRRTKVVQPSKASAPSGDDESSNSSSENKKKKLELYLKDFDMRVANCLLQADNECKAICAAINHACMMELLKLPKNIREMTRAEFMAKGGSVNNNVLHQVTEVVDSITSSILPTTALSAENKTVPSSQGDSSASETAQGAETAGTKKKAAKGRKRTTTATASKRKTRQKSVLGTNQDVNTLGSAEPPQTLRRSTRKTARNTFVTPATRTGKAKAMASGWDTPAITPKFDPRLPVTPATCTMREVKRGETIMSLSGSPLALPSKPALPSAKPDGSIITFGDGTALEIMGTSPKVDMSMNETTRQNIRLLQNNLAKILKTCSTGQENSKDVPP